MVGKDYSFYLTALSKLEDDLLDMKEDVLDPVMRFMSGSPKTIYDEARSYLEEQAANFSYVKGDEGSQLRDILADDNCYKGNLMQQAKSLLDTLKEKVKFQIEEEREKAIATVKILADRLAGMDDFANLKTEEQEKVQTPFKKLEQELKQQKLIAVIRDRLRSFEEGEYSRLLAKVVWLAAAKEKKDDDKVKPEGKDTGTGGSGEISEKEPEYIHGRSIKVTFAKPMLVDVKDVEEYLSVLREAYMKEINEGKRIQI